VCASKETINTTVLVPHLIVLCYVAIRALNRQTANICEFIVVLFHTIQHYKAFMVDTDMVLICIYLPNPLYIYT